MGHGFAASGQKRAAGFALVALTLAGCGAAARDAAPSAAQLQADYKGAPPALAALHASANELLGGGSVAFRRELRALRGYPVVVNKWASWCTPCQQESAIFQQVAPRFARTVAFIGDDVNDPGRAAAEGWLRGHPVSYPSFFDSSGAINHLLAKPLAPASFDYRPVTYFYNRRGQQVYFSFGPFVSNASLEHAIRLYLGA